MDLIYEMLNEFVENGEMTREEAIKQLQQIIDVAHRFERNEKEIDAFDEEAILLAIKALESQDRKVDVEQATANFAKKLEEGYFKPRRKCLADYLSDDPSLLRKVGAEELGIESPSKRSEQTGEEIADFVETLFADVDVQENRTSGSSTDAVSREDARRLHCKICRDYCTCYRNIETCEDLKAFDSLPPVTPHPKTGYWIANKAKNYPGWVHCSECGEDWTHDGRPPYCPACGARMIEEE